MSFLANSLSRYALGSVALYGAGKLASAYTANAMQEAVKAGITLVGSAVKTSLQFTVATGLIYGGYKAACAIHAYAEPVNHLFDRGFNEEKWKRVQSIVPPLTLAVSTLPLVALTAYKIYL